MGFASRIASRLIFDFGGYSSPGQNNETIIFYIISNTFLRWWTITIYINNMHIFVRNVQSYHINFLLKQQNLKARAQGGALPINFYCIFFPISKIIESVWKYKENTKKNERRLQGDIISIDIVAVIRFIRCITLKSMFTF